MLENYNDILNISDICEVLHIGRNTAYKLIHSGSLKSFRIGKAHKIPKLYLIEYITKTA